MSLFRRRDPAGSSARDALRHRADKPPDADKARDGEAAAVAHEQPPYEQPPSLIGLYLTDGRSLFHVEGAIRDPSGGALLLELENCGTLELIVCSHGAVDGLDLHPVSPATEGVLETSGRSPDGANHASRAPARLIA